MAADAHWYKRFRDAAFISAAGVMILTFIIVLPVHPFSYLPPIIVGGGPGEWFTLGYVLYATFGLVGFAVLSALVWVIEVHEGRRMEGRTMSAALILLFAGVTLSCILLMTAGALGGYAITIQGQTTQSAQGILTPFVYPTSLTALAAVVGMGLLVLGLTSAKAHGVE